MFHLTQSIILVTLRKTRYRVAEVIDDNMITVTLDMEPTKTTTRTRTFSLVKVDLFRPTAG